LGDGSPLETCLAEARQAISLYNEAPAWAIPTLHAADGRLFELEPGLPTPDSALTTALECMVEIICNGQVSGVGFLVRSDGLALTTQFAVEGDSPLALRTQHGDLKAHLVTANSDENLALLKVEGEAFPHLQLAPVPLPTPGAQVQLLGRNPETGIETFSGQVRGLSQLNGYPAAHLLAVKTDAPRRLGAAPAFDAQGRLLGMVVMMNAVGEAADMLYLRPSADLAAFIQQVSSQ
jgi:hypothetical protein